MLLRALFATAILTTALPAVDIAQSRDRSSSRSGNTSCADYVNNDRASYCEVREETIGGAKRGKARLNLHLLFTCLRRPDGL